MHFYVRNFVDSGQFYEYNINYGDSFIAAGMFLKIKKDLHLLLILGKMDGTIFLFISTG